MDTTPEYLDTAQAAQITPGRPSSNTLWRWAQRGILVPSGERVYLKHSWIGGKVMTTREWLFSFFDVLTEAKKHQPAPAASRTVRRSSSARRERQKADARRELAKA